MNKSMEQELSNEHVDHDAEAIWREALAQPEFKHVAKVYCYASMATSDHRNGRCCDFMVYYTDEKMSDAERVTMGDNIRRYFIEHAHRLNVQGIIWDHHVTGFPETHELNSGPGPHETYRGPSGAPRPYFGPNPHTDHVHVQVSGAPARYWLQKEEDNMPTPKDFWTSADADVIPAPERETNKDNPNWRPSSYLKTILDTLDAQAKAIDALTGAVAHLSEKVGVPDASPAKK